VADQASSRVLHGHNWIVYGVAWSPEGLSPRHFCEKRKVD
jgi:hypothetical protein